MDNAELDELGCKPPEEPVEPVGKKNQFHQRFRGRDLIDKLLGTFLLIQSLYLRDQL